MIEGKDFERINIDEKTYVRYFSENKFEIHISATGPTGAWVYFFEDGVLIGRQRRSYAGVSKLQKVKYEE